MIEVFDYSILSFFQSIANPVLDALMSAVTVLGNSGMLWLLIALIFLIIPKYRKIGVFMLLAMGIAYLIGNLGLKNWIARPRPCWRHPNVALLVEVPRDFSFPSGHTMHSVIGAFGVWKANKKWGFVAFFMATWIAVTRMYLYVHYPTDILGGFFVGILIAMGVWYVSEHRVPARKEKGDAV